MRGKAIIVVAKDTIKIFLFIGIRLYFTKSSKYFSYIFELRNFSSSFFEERVKQYKARRRNTVVGKRGTTIPITPKEKDKIPNIKNTIFINLNTFK